jgi:hypothetical protein
MGLFWIHIGHQHENSFENLRLKRGSGVWRDPESFPQFAGVDPLLTEHCGDACLLIFKQVTPEVEANTTLTATLRFVASVPIDLPLCTANNNLTKTNNIHHEIPISNLPSRHVYRRYRRRNGIQRERCHLS